MLRGKDDPTVPIQRRRQFMLDGEALTNNHGDSSIYKFFLAGEPETMAVGGGSLAAIGGCCLCPGLGRSSWEPYSASWCKMWPNLHRSQSISYRFASISIHFMSICVDLNPFRVDLRRSQSISCRFASISVDFEWICVDLSWFCVDLLRS